MLMKLKKQLKMVNLELAMDANTSDEEKLTQLRERKSALSDKIQRQHKIIKQYRYRHRIVSRMSNHSNSDNGRSSIKGWFFTLIHLTLGAKYPTISSKFTY